MASKADLVEKIKTLQRTDPAAKQAWWDYCDHHLEGAKDPNRHEADTLHDFLTNYENGGSVGKGKGRYRSIIPARAPGPSRPSNRFNPPSGHNLAMEIRNLARPIAATPHLASPLVDSVKTGQRSSSHFKHAWHTYCTMYGHGMYDPAKHEESFVKSFLDYMGEVTVKCLESLEGIDSETPAKRPIAAIGSLDTAPAVKRPRLADNTKGSLVEQIKALQRTSPELKEAWWTFCEAEHGGIKDPNRHSEEVLQQFLSDYAPP